jgi:hypothetical protein
MRKIIFVLFGLIVNLSLFAQTALPKINTQKNLPNDHFMVQVSSDYWLNAPDSISSHRDGSTRGANVYFMINKPFQSNAHLSAAFGLGVGTSHHFFSRMSADITGITPLLKFRALDTLTRFSKYKISTTYLELPIELRYFSKPENPNKSVKIAVGVKIGTLLNAHSKGKTLVNASGTKLKDYTEKLTSKSYFNTSRLAVTARVGYGNFSVFGSCNITQVFKDKVATNMSLLQVGINLAGL